jgi:hypothetical protein
MTEKKTCPILSVGTDTLEECVEEHCAWYDTTFETCILKNISDDLDRIAALLKLIWESKQK